MSSNSERLLDYEGAAKPSSPGWDADNWPVEVNGHRVYPTEPDHVKRGGDPDIAFECAECGRHVIPPAPHQRSIPDRDWAENRFDTIECGGCGVHE